MQIGYKVDDQQTSKVLWPEKILLAARKSLQGSQVLAYEYLEGDHSLEPLSATTRSSPCISCPRPFQRGNACSGTSREFLADP